MEAGTEQKTDGAQHLPMEPLPCVLEMEKFAGKQPQSSFLLGR